MKKTIIIFSIILFLSVSISFVLGYKYYNYEPSEKINWRDILTSVDCPHYNTPVVIEYIEKHPKLSFWQSVINDLDHLLPWVPVDVYLFAKNNGYDIVKKTFFNGITIASLYRGKYRIYLVRRSNIIGYSYILVDGKSMRFNKGEEFSEIEKCLPYE